MSNKIDFYYGNLPSPVPGQNCTVTAIATWTSPDVAPYAVFASARNAAGTYVSSKQLTPPQGTPSPYLLTGSLPIPSSLTSPVTLCLAAEKMDGTTWAPSVCDAFDPDPGTNDEAGEPPTPPPPLSPIEPGGPL